MDKSKKILVRAGAVLSGLTMLPGAVLAATNPFSSGGGAVTNLTSVQGTSGLGGGSLPAIVGTMINVILGFLGIVLLGYVLLAGYTWMSAGGDDKKVKESKDMLKNAVIGLVIIVAGYAITSFVITSLATVTTTP